MPAAPLGPLARARLAAEIAATYRRARRALRDHDLPEALSSLRRAGAGAATDGGALTVWEGRRLGRAVQRTLGVLPADSRCLMQSLVLTELLTRRGTPSKLVIGVRPGERFGAHAWVELDGAPLLPPGDGDYARLTEL